jgi:hypothetical protein
VSMLRRHRALRDVPEGDVITQTEPEIDAKPAKRSTKGKSDQPTGENPTPARETATGGKPAPKGDDE